MSVAQIQKQNLTHLCGLGGLRDPQNKIRRGEQLTSS